MNNLQKSLGIGALVLALTGCQDKSVNQTATQPAQDKPKLEEQVNEFGEKWGSYKQVARYELMEATKYWSVKYWKSPESQVLDDKTQKEVVDGIVRKAEALVGRGYPAELVSDYFTFARELAAKNGLKLPEQKLNSLQTNAVNRNISYELGTARSRIVDDDFPSSAESHFDTAVHVAKQFGVNIATSQHRKLYSEVKGLLQTKYNITK